MKGGGAGEAEADPARLAARRAPCRRRGMLDPLEDRARFSEQRFARLGQLDTARLAAKQLYIELLLEGSDLLAERRLLDAEPLGRPGHMPGFRDRHEIAKMAQLHLP